MVALLARMFEEVVEQQTHAAQPLHRTYQQLGQRLAPALALALAHLKELRKEDKLS